MADKVQKTFEFNFTAKDLSALEAVRDLQEEYDSISAKAQRAADASAKYIEDGTIDAWKKATAAVRDYDRAVKQALADNSAANQATALAAQFDAQGGDGRGGFGLNVGSAANDFAALAGALGDSSAGAIRFAGDIAGAAEQVPRLFNAISAGIASVNPLVLAAGAVAGAVALAVKQINDSAADLTKQAIAATNANADVERSIAEGLDTEQAKARIEELNKARQAEQDIIQRETEARERANQAAKDGGLLGSAALAIFNTINEAEENSGKVLSEAQANAEAFTAEIDRLTQAVNEGELAANDAVKAEQELAQAREQLAGVQANAIREVSTLLANGLDSEGLGKEIDRTREQLVAEAEIRARLTQQGLQNTEAYKQSEQATAQLNERLSELTNVQTLTEVSANDAAKAEADLIETRKNAEAAIEQLQAQEQQLMETYDERRAQVEAQRARQDAINEEDSAIRTKQRAEDLQRALAAQAEAHKDRLLQIEQDGADRIAALRQALADREADTLQRIQEIQDSFAVERARKVREFEQAQLQAQEEYEARRLQIQQQTDDSLFDALLANDVTAALKAEREGQQALNDLDSNFSREQRRAKDAFEYQLQLDEQRKNEQIQNLQAELDAFRVNTAAKIQAELEAIETRKQAEIAAYEEQLQRDADLRAIQEQREKEAAELRKQRLEEQRRLEDEAAQKALDKSLADIETKREAEEAALDSIIAKVQQLNGVINSGSTSTPPPGASTTPVNKDLYGGGGYPVKDLNTGEEFLIPDSASGVPLSSTSPDFLSGGRGNSRPATVMQLNLNLGGVTVGELVTPSELEEVVDAINKGVRTNFVEMSKALVGANVETA